MGRRWLLAVGTAHFENLEDADLPLVPKELKRIAESFGLIGYDRQFTSRSLDPDSKELRGLFAAIKNSSGSGDFVVAYYTGHGARDLERFYLLTRDSELEKLDETAVAAEDLARALTKESKASQILVILDACYSGAGASEFAQVANRLTTLFGSGAGLFVIAAARSKEEAEQEVLSTALADALANHGGRLGGRLQEFLTTDDVMDFVDSYLRQKHPNQIATLSAGNVRGRCRLFPNRHHRPEIGPGVDLETQRSYVEHWEPKARGAEIGMGGWYFTGRQRVLGNLVRWLKAKRSDGRARVVTGSAGRGKSAVLARIVTLANPHSRRDILNTTLSDVPDLDTIPPEGCVNVAVHARRKSLAYIVDQVASDLGLHASDAPQLIEEVARRSTKTVIIIDALDEADESEVIASTLLKPLATIPHVFLLIGTRPDSTGHGQRFRGLDELTEEIDLDASRYVEARDVARYVERRLLAAEEPGRRTPYQSKPESAHLIAQAVAERANNIFLVAHTATHALLANSSGVDTSDPGWAEQLPTGLEDAFAQFVFNIEERRPSGLTSAQVRATLLPLAFAEGEGLPWVDLWAVVATALSGGEIISDTVIAQVQNHAAAFIIENIEFDRSVYRLYHERLAEHLRESVPHVIEPHRLIVEALLSCIPRSNADHRDWSRAHPYLKKHLASHASKAGCLESLVTDPRFLLAADPETLMPHLATIAQSQPSVVRSYRRAFGWMHERTEEERLPYLALALAQEGLGDMAGKLRGTLSSPVWMPVWMSWEKPSPCHILVRGEAAVSALATGQWGADISVALVGRTCGTIEVLQLTDGRRLAAWSPNIRERVTQVFLTSELLLIASWENGRFGVRDISRRIDHMCAENFQEREITAMCAVNMGEQQMCVTAHKDGSIAIWQVPFLYLLKRKHHASYTIVGALAVCRVGSENLIISGGDSVTSDSNERFSRLRLWSLKDLELLWESGADDKGCITSIDVFFHGEQVYVVTSQSHWGPPEIWRVQERSMELVYRGDKSSDRSWLHETKEGLWLYSVRFRKLDVISVQLSTESTRWIDVFVPRQTSAFIEGNHLSRLVWINKQPSVLSSQLTSVQVWDLHDLLESGMTTDQQEQDELNVACLAIDHLHTPVLYCGIRRGEVIAFDALTGTPVSRIMIDRPVTAIAFFSMNNERALVIGDGQGTLQVEPIGSYIATRRVIHAGELVQRVSVAWCEGRPLIFAAVKTSEIWAIRVWNLRTGEEIPTPSDYPNARWRFQLTMGQEDKPIHGLVVINRGNGARIAFASKYAQVMVADYDEQEASYSTLYHFLYVWVIPDAIGEEVSALACSDDIDGRLLAAGTHYGNMAVWDFADGTLLASRSGAHLGLRIGALVFHASEGTTFLVSGGTDGVIRLWTSKLELLMEIEIGTPVAALVFTGPTQLGVGTRQGVVVVELNLQRLFVKSVSMTDNFF